MNTIVRGRDNRDLSLCLSAAEDRIDALKRALEECRSESALKIDVLSRFIVDLQRQIEQRDEVIDAMRKAGGKV